VGQAGGSEHERGRDEEHVDRALAAVGVRRETKIRDDVIQTREQVRVGAADLAAERKLRDRIARDLQRDEDRRDRVREIRTSIARPGVGDAFMPLQA
jgi:hypothetical protein